jgi:hypothetical protein
MNKLYAVYYRSADGIDYPMDIYTQGEYERIGDKYATGDPDGVYFEENLTLSSQRFHIWPTVNSQNTASLVIGTDANNYVCIRNIVGTTLVQPTTGANYLLFWQATDTAGSAWVTGTAYTAPKVIRYHHRRPLWDFDTTSDSPDMPAKYLRFLLHSLCRDLSPAYGIPIEERRYHEKMAMDAYEERLKINRFTFRRI